MQTTLISLTAGYEVIGLLGVVLIFAAYIFSRKRIVTRESFLVNERTTHWWEGSALSVMALMGTGIFFMSAYAGVSGGLLGAVLFMLPTIIAFLVFTIVALKVKDAFPKGFSLPQYLYDRHGSQKIRTVVSLVLFLKYFAIIVLITYLGTVAVSAISAIHSGLLIFAVMVIAVLTILLSGFRSVIAASYLQTAAVILVVLLIIPWIVGTQSENIVVFTSHGEYLKMATLGVIVAIALVAHMVTDQFYWQQVFALERDQIKKSFGLGLVLWLCMFIGFSILGMLFAHAGGGMASTGYMFADLVMMLTIIMVMVSTVMCSLSAVGSLWSTDMTRYNERETRALMKYGRGDVLTAAEERILFERDKEAVQSARRAIIIMAILAGIATYLVARYIA